ncbi:FecR family protein [Pedobacter africanus]|nr:FecR domain-containing protein [Pedobacter africanus]
MNKEGADRILEKYLAGQASAEETALIECWYLNASDERKLTDMDSFERLNDELWRGTIERAGLLPAKKPVRKLWLRMVAAASVILVTLWFFRDKLPGSNPELVIAVNQTAPGHNRATLTFANGEIIQLSEAQTGVVVHRDQLSYNDGSPVNTPQEPKTAAEIQLTAATPRGGTYQVTLPDGTRVWLNAATKLVFPSKFNDRERKVQLSGEAYFEVAKSRERMPFIVISKNQEVAVLGTHFNISSYPDENNVKTTLLEGRVSVRNTLSNEQSSIILKPGQQAVVGSGSGIKITEADLEMAIAWKNGLFYFKDADLKTILRTFSRWYDIDLISTELPADRKFSGKLYRNMDAPQALQVLKLLDVELSLEKGMPKVPQKNIVKP